MNRKTRWTIFGGAILLLAVALFFLTREPPPPFQFLSKYPVVERKSSPDGSRRFLIVKANFEDLARDAEAEIHPTMVSSSTSGYNGIMRESRSYGTTEGLVELSTDLSGSTFDDGPKGIGPDMAMDMKDGYCAIAYTRPKSLMDRAFDWVRGLFGPKVAQAVPPQDGVMVESYSWKK